MPTHVFLMVLAAALVHSTWNALVKTDDDRLSLIKLMSVTQIVVSLCFVPFVAIPAMDSWPYVLASSVLNTGYMLMLNRAYQAGDLSLIYPFARGVAPLVVAGVSAVLLGEKLSSANQAAVMLMGLGITSLALTQRPASLVELRPLAFALATGAFIAGYTIVDGLGARIAGSAHSYMIWLSLITSILVVACANLLQRGQPVPIGRRNHAVARHHSLCLFHVPSHCTAHGEHAHCIHIIWLLLKRLFCCLKRIDARIHNEPSELNDPTVLLNHSGR